MVGEARDVKVHMTEPAITDFDLYLFGEGKHERIYDELGAMFFIGPA
jgi:hypothetical protein